MNWYKIGGVIILIVLLVTLVSYVRSKNEYYELKAAREDAESTQKIGQEKKEYVAKRKSECYGYFEKERKQWNNVVSQRYDEENDACYIAYKDNKNPAKSKEECQKIINNVDVSSSWWLRAYRQYELCLNNHFENEF